MKKAPAIDYLLTWKANRIDQEVRLDDAALIDGFWNCDRECYVIRENRPLEMQVGTHIAVCLNSAFEQEDFLKFTRRNWDFLLDAMEHRNGTLE